MTEAEWLVSDDPTAMADAALKSLRVSDRVCRLYIAAFWGWQALRLPDDQRQDLQARVAAMEHWAETGKLPKRTRASRSENVIFFNRNAPRAVASTVHSPASWGTPAHEATLIQSHFLRDIFGNPFRPVALDPAWLTSDVLLLAHGIYEKKVFDRMPILADALQDAGCANDEVLTHCRDTKPVHVRGCWVVDLVLGRS